MKKELSKTQAQEKINNFFKEDFTSDEMKKIKRLAMKYKIRLGNLRKNFCKKCLSKIKGEISINKGYKTIICSSCSYKNRYKIN